MPEDAPRRDPSTADAPDKDVLRVVLSGADAPDEDEPGGRLKINPHVVEEGLGETDEDS